MNLVARFLLVALLAPCAALADPWKDESGQSRDKGREGQIRHGDVRPMADWRAEVWQPGDPVPLLYPPLRAREHIPRGHMPPPGECRLWLPDRPPGDQPPPYRC